jgi:glucose-1-phosphate thymidylyltransferase
LLNLAREVLARRHVVEEVRDEVVWVDSSSHVHDSAVLEGPVVIGPDCEIGPDAVIGPDVAVGPNVTIGANTVVQRSLLDADTRIDPSSTLIETVTGQDVHLGANTIVPGGPADVQVGTDIFEDQDLGAVVADRVHARGDVSFAPGTLVGPNATLHAGVTVSDNVNEGAEVVR